MKKNYLKFIKLFKLSYYLNSTCVILDSLYKFLLSFRLIRG